jgi:hypothetical protein
MFKIKILIIAGKNSYLAIRELNKFIDDAPFLISLGNLTDDQSDEEFNNFKDF